MAQSGTNRGRRPAEGPGSPPVEHDLDTVPVPAPERNRPIHVEKIGLVRAAVWANDGGQTGVYYTVTVSRIYKDGQGKWQSTDRFGRDDLLVLAKVLDRVHSWICDLPTNHGTPARGDALP